MCNLAENVSAKSLFLQEMAEEERDAILSRKEMVSGENMQLIVEAEHIRWQREREPNSSA